MATEKRAAIDWESVEREYRAGIKSFKMLADEFNVSVGGIHKRAKQYEWTRNLSDRIAERAARKVNELAVNAEVNAEKRNASDAEIVEANATMQTDIIVSHRTDIQRSRKMVMSLMSELEFQTDNMDLMHQLAELLESPDEKGVDKRNELFNKIISLGSRTSTMKALAESLRTLVALEREAFGIDAKGAPETPKTQKQVDDELASLLKKAMNGNRGA